jgi:hypothetical protein
VGSRAFVAALLQALPPTGGRDGAPLASFHLPLSFRAFATSGGM